MRIYVALAILAIAVLAITGCDRESNPNSPAHLLSPLGAVEEILIDFDEKAENGGTSCETNITDNGTQFIATAICKDNGKEMTTVVGVLVDSDDNE